MTSNETQSANNRAIGTTVWDPVVRFGHRALVAAFAIAYFSGGDSDGAAGLGATDHGGTAFVQDPKEAAMPSMPRSAIIADHPDACLPVEEIARRVRVFCSSGRAV